MPRVENHRPNLLTIKGVRIVAMTHVNDAQFEAIKAHPLTKHFVKKKWISLHADIGMDPKAILISDIPEMLNVHELRALRDDENQTSEIRSAASARLEALHTPPSEDGSPSTDGETAKGGKGGGKRG